MYNFKIKKFLDFEIYYRYKNAIYSAEKRDKYSFQHQTKEMIKDFGDVVTIEKDEGREEANLLRSLRRTKNSIYDYACSNDWTGGYFMTITFDKKYLNRYDHKQCYKKIKSYLDNLRKKNKNMKYLFVCEPHKDNAWHFHGLMVDCNLKLKHFKDDIYSVDNYKWGYTQVTYVKDTLAVSKYITKYITKEMNLPKGFKKYIRSNNLDKPIVNTYLVSENDLDLEFDFKKEIVNDYQSVDIYYKSL